VFPCSTIMLLSIPCSRYLTFMQHTKELSYHSLFPLPLKQVQSLNVINLGQSIQWKISAVIKIRKIYCPLNFLTIGSMQYDMDDMNLRNKKRKKERSTNTGNSSYHCTTVQLLAHATKLILLSEGTKIHATWPLQHYIPRSQEVGWDKGEVG
jgi:hypothetical protein